METNSFLHIESMIKALTREAGEPTQFLQKVTELLAEEVEVFDWVGFYIAAPADRTLHLGPFTGEPTEHTHIPYGSGICGQAAQSEELFVVPDIKKESNYLSCSLHVKAEIVVPVQYKGRLVGELDIDSHTPDPFREPHQHLCRFVARSAAEPCAALASAY